jgi:hypothetical protein
VVDPDECDRESQEFDHNEGVMDDNDGDENDNDIDHNRNDDVGRKGCTLDKGNGKKKVKTVKKKGSGGLGYPHTQYSRGNTNTPQADWVVLEKIQSDGYTGEQLKYQLRVRNLRYSGSFACIQAYLYEWLHFLCACIGL